MRKWKLAVISIPIFKPGCHSLLPISEHKFLTKAAQLHAHRVLMVAIQPFLSPAICAWGLSTRLKIPVLSHRFELAAQKQMETEAEARESALLCGTFPSTFNQRHLRNEGSMSMQSSTGNISQCSIIILRFLWRVFSPVIFFFLVI